MLSLAIFIGFLLFIYLVNALTTMAFYAKEMGKYNAFTLGLREVFITETEFLNEVKKRTEAWTNKRRGR